MRNLAEAETIARVADSEGDEPSLSITEFLDSTREGVREFTRSAIESFAEDEFLRYMGCAPYERSEARSDYRNGTVPHVLETRFGRIENIGIPRARRSGFLCSILNRWMRKDEKITSVVIEMFLRGVSTRKVKELGRLLWGRRLSSSTVSRRSEKVRGDLIRWLNRPITKAFSYLFIDGVNLNIRRRVISKEALLCMVGVTESGEKEFLGFLLGGRESRLSWENALLSLVKRGPHPRTVKLIVRE